MHPITGVATSITAFVGYAARGPVNDPTMVQSFTEFGHLRVRGSLGQEHDELRGAAVLPGGRATTR